MIDSYRKIRYNTFSMSRISFTFAKTPELEAILKALEKEFSGLSRSEVVKLALVEFYKMYQRRERMMQEEALKIDGIDELISASLKSGVDAVLNSPEEIDQYFKKF